MNQTLGNIYIVDDDEHHRISLKKLLVDYKFNVFDFDSASQFLDQSELVRPAALLLDMRMPLMSGLDLQKSLAEKNIKLPIIFLSGQSFHNEIIDSFRLGAFDFILKPFDCDELIEKITKAIDCDNNHEISTTNKDKIKDLFNKLTNREVEIYKLINEGLMNTEIAETLCITARTVKFHKSQIMQKMNSKTSQDLLKKWIEIHQ